MNKNTIKDVAMVLAIALLVINFFNTYEMKRELTELRGATSGMEQRLINRIGSEVRGGYANIEEMLNKEQSIFTETLVEMRARGKKIEVTMKGVPKEIGVTEKLIGRVAAGGKIYEQELDENNQGVILVDIAEKISPIFIIQSDTGVRQEAYGDLYTGDIFNIHIMTEWELGEKDSGGTQILTLETVSDKNSFTAEEIEMAEFIVEKTGIPSGGPVPDVAAAEHAYERTEEYLNSLQGDRVSATFASGEKPNTIKFSADFSSYVHKEKSERYRVNFLISTKDGMKYVTSGSIADFTVTDKGVSKSSTDGTLLPLFESAAVE